VVRTETRGPPAPPANRLHGRGDGGASVNQIVPTQLRASRFSGELGFERVYDHTKTFEIYPAVLSSLKLTDRFLKFGKGSAPLPQHERSIPNRCSRVNTLTPENELSTTDFY
jgi:hypothetical protein